MPMNRVRLSPYADFLGIRHVGVVDGGPLLAMAYSDGLGGWPGLLHGGAVAGLLELAAIAAIQAALDEPVPPTVKPVTVTIDFMRGARPVETCALGRVSRLGSRVANVTVEAWQDDPARPIAGARMNVVLARP